MSVAGSESEWLDLRVGVLGASSFIGDCLLPMLLQQGREVWGFTRGAARHHKVAPSGVTWRDLSAVAGDASTPRLTAVVEGGIPSWVCLNPIWTLHGYLPLLEANGARRIVALSSTSRFTKGNSPDSSEQELARRIAESEDKLARWAETNGAEWLILRPTLVYGLGRDRNISDIARFIRRFGFFPLLGQARGLRQPVHSRDVAGACCAGLVSGVKNRAYNISGGETLAYREMVARVFVALNRKPRFLPLPRPCISLGVSALRLLPRFRDWSMAMAERTNLDLVFDHTEAARDLGFTPSALRIDATDLPPSRSA